MKTYHKRKQNRRRNTKKNRKNRSKKGGGDGDTDIAYGFTTLQNIDTPQPKNIINNVFGFINKSYNIYKDNKDNRGVIQKIQSYIKVKNEEITKLKKSLKENIIELAGIHNNTLQTNQTSIIQNIKNLEGEIKELQNATLTTYSKMYEPNNTDSDDNTFEKKNITLGKNDYLRNNNRNTNNLGEGSFGTVEIWENKRFFMNTPTLYAVKIQDYNNDDDPEKRDRILKEVQILEYIKNQNHKCKEKIVCFKGVYDDKSKKIIYIATDYTDEKYSLYDFFNKNSKSLQNVKNLYIIIEIFSQILDVIYYLQTLNILHSDIKPENILCNIDKIVGFKKLENIKIKIIDFGLSEKIEDGYNPIKHKGTYSYMDPLIVFDDIFNNTPSNNLYIDLKQNIFELHSNYIKCDLWSVGMIFYRFICNIYTNMKTIFDLISMYDKDNPDTIISNIYYYNLYYIYYDYIISKTTTINIKANLINDFKNSQKQTDEEIKTSIEKVINIFKDHFTILQSYSVIFEKYANQHNMTFAKIEDLLNPKPDERQITYNKSKSE